MRDLIASFILYSLC